MQPLYDLTPFTMLDYPGKTACILWFAGCNMRCAYCHNPNIVRRKGQKNIDEVLAFLKKRRGRLDGVVLSGGEATLYPDLLDLAQIIKSLGYAIKLDTNGSRPDVLKSLIHNALLDYVAMDYKAPFGCFETVSGGKNRLLDKFWHSLDILNESPVPFEIRTTACPSLLKGKDLITMEKSLRENGYKNPYYIQKVLQHNDNPLMQTIETPDIPYNIDTIQSTAIGHIVFRNF